MALILKASVKLSKLKKKNYTGMEVKLRRWL